MTQFNEQGSSFNAVEQPTEELQGVGDSIDQLGGRTTPTSEVEDFIQLAQEGFSEEQLARILRLRRLYFETDENEITPEYKRLRFVRYLREEGKISD